MKLRPSRYFPSLGVASLDTVPRSSGADVPQALPGTFDYFTQIVAAPDPFEPKAERRAPESQPTLGDLASTYYRLPTPRMPLPPPIEPASPNPISPRSEEATATEPAPPVDEEAARLREAWVLLSASFFLFFFLFGLYMW